MSPWILSKYSKLSEMIILDTNIISELMKPSPAVSVLRWLECQQMLDLYVTTISLAEISYGLNCIPEGKRRRKLENAFQMSILASFKHRLLPLSEEAAYEYGGIMGNRKREGRPLSILDGQIAAITAVHKAVLATRNVKDFEACDIELMNPFDF